MLGMLVMAAANPVQAASATSSSGRSVDKPGTVAKPAARKSSAVASKSKPKQKPVKRKRRSTRNAARVDAIDDMTLRSNSVLVVDQDSGELVALKNPDTVMPIASLTKMMTALVVVDAHLPLDEVLEIGPEDVDTERHTHSRLSVGTELRRDEMLLLALMSSENRAAKALGRHYPGGRTAFIAAMNEKARTLGMTHTRFADTAGLSNGSQSTARDLQHLIRAAHAQPLLRAYSTQPEADVKVKGRTLTFVNSNRLVRSTGGDWQIDLQKTGFTNEAGRCLIMHATVLSRRLMMVFLDSNGTMTRYADAARIRRQLELQAKVGSKPVKTQEASVIGAAS
ncbi:MAG: peptidase S11 [Xanthomonadaceae bacterium]|nr:peptidase S11 [Xanthomonadaceae bacterium]